jgi:uncharacterized protein YigE (DUF2233 family)
MWRRFLALVALLAVVVPAAAEPACQSMVFEEADYTVCRFDLRKDRLSLFNLDAEGVPYGSFSALSQALQAQGKTLAFAMNAGMYDEAQKPIGLYIEAGKQAHKINRRNGAGNFHLKPNGVFYVAGKRAGVLDTEAFVKAGLTPDYATQSGPMLVIDGRIHPKFSATGNSLKRRNGVGVVDDHTVVFAITEGVANFYSFARLFRDGLDCRNALFFDGSVSSLYAPDLGRSDGYFPLGPIVAVVRDEAP